MRPCNSPMRIFPNIALCVGIILLLGTVIPGMAQAQKTEIRYMTFVDPGKPDPRSKALQESISSFEKKYPQYKVVCFGAFVIA